MKVLSAVSVHQYEQAVRALRAYSETILMGLAATDEHATRSSLQRSSERVLSAIVFGSDHGLCGRFNQRIADFTVRQHNRKEGPPLANLLAVGEQTHAWLAHRGMSVDDCFMTPSSAAGVDTLVRALLLKLDSWREQDGVTDVVLFYNRLARTQAASYTPTQQHLLPVRHEHLGDHLGEHIPKRWPGRSQPLYTLPRTQLLRALRREYIFVSLYRAAAESSASEHTSRLESMQLAEKNIERRLARLQSDLRRQRQSSITDEMLSLASAYETMVTDE